MLPPPLDVLLVTGPLGSGKTTTVNHLLRAEIEAGRRVAVLINEFGTVSIDEALMAARTQELAGIENLVNGCACCSLRSEVIAVLKAWSECDESRRPQRVILETTGLADPTDLVDLDQEPELRSGLRLAGCLTVLSALTPLHHLQQRLLVRHQVALASLVHVSKWDLDPMQAMAWETQIRQAFPAKPIARTYLGKAPATAPNPWTAGNLPPADPTEPAVHAFSESRAITVSWDHPVDPERLEYLLRTGLPGGELLRAKGIAAFPDQPARHDGSDRWAFHLADGRVEIMPLPLREDGSLWPLQAVVIGTGLDVPAWRQALRALECPPTGARHRVPRLRVP